MSLDQTESRALARYLRMPAIPGDAPRSPKMALLHALPASAYVTLHYWLVGAGLLWLLDNSLPLARPVFWALGVLLVVAAGVASWATFVSFIEVEAMLEE